MATNTYEQADDLGTAHGGRLASWDGVQANWTIIESTAFFEITGRKNFGCAIFASGMDDKSVKLNVLDNGCSDAPVPPDMRRWQRYRLPKSTHTHDHLWCTEWPRIREVG